ncbi:MAG: flagellar basal body-associated FliL family protein [Actinomycetota bacterium]|nr:flagellar basal body-associated FliL family protein [Actinomycetota bacterium]
MAKKKTKQASTEEAAEGSSKLKMIGMAAAFVAIGAVAGPKLMGGAPAQAASGEATTTTVEPGPIVVLDKVTLNLADGHLLQVGLALELSPGAGSGGGHGTAAEDDPTKGYAKALDATIEILGGESMGSLSEAGGRDRAKHALEEELHELYHGEVVGVFFHQFVMQ